MYFLKSFAYAGIAVAILDALGAVVVLPAILAVLGTQDRQGNPVATPARHQRSRLLARPGDDGHAPPSHHRGRRHRRAAAFSARRSCASTSAFPTTGSYRPACDQPPGPRRHPYQLRLRTRPGRSRSSPRARRPGTSANAAIGAYAARSVPAVRSRTGRRCHRFLRRRPPGPTGQSRDRATLLGTERQRRYLALCRPDGRARIHQGRNARQDDPIHPGPFPCPGGRAVGSAGRFQGIAVRPAADRRGNHRPGHPHRPVPHDRQRRGADQGDRAQPAQPHRYLRRHGLGLPGRATSLTCCTSHPPAPSTRRHRS